MDLTGEFLAALEKYYPYTGYFGNQMPVYDWDHATTGEQRKLLKRSGLIQKTLSTQEIAEKFKLWLQKKNIHADQGF